MGKVKRIFDDLVIDDDISCIIKYIVRDYSEARSVAKDVETYIFREGTGATDNGTFICKDDQHRVVAAYSDNCLILIGSCDTVNRTIKYHIANCDDIGVTYTSTLDRLKSLLSKEKYPCDSTVRDYITDNNILPEGPAKNVDIISLDIQLKYDSTIFDKIGVYDMVKDLESRIRENYKEVVDSIEIGLSDI